jgi:hypothetical protein
MKSISKSLQKKVTQRRSANTRRLGEVLHPIAGYQWGEPFQGEESFRLTRNGNIIEITAVMPRYESAEHPSDLIRQYELAHKAQKVSKGHSKDAPHIRFANAESDDALIDFVLSFGPVVASTWTNRVPHLLTEMPESEGSSYIELPIWAEQNLVELRNEQSIYKAALELVFELVKKEKEYDEKAAKAKIAVIARLVRSWPLQWRRERKARGKAPLWKVQPSVIERIDAMTTRKPLDFLPPQVDARIVLSELINVFPAFVFPNLAEMHSYQCYGIRPLLYSLLRKEFVHSSDTAVCVNTKCRQFFEVERSEQKYCSPDCSRQHRQRDYWQQSGKALRGKRKSEIKKI